MLRALLKPIWYILAVALSVIYVPDLLDLTKSRSVLYAIPIWIVAGVGAVAMIEWLENRFLAKANVPTDILNDAYPTPSIRAFDWEELLFANERTVEAAMVSAKTGRLNGLGIVADNKAQLIARWSKKGWEITTESFDKAGLKIALTDEHKSAGKLIQKSRWKYILFGAPSQPISDELALQIIRNFLGWAEEPDQIS